MTQQIGNLPHRLCIQDGALTMLDGSDVGEYLRSTGMADCSQVVILPRGPAMEMEQQAAFYRSLRASDLRFIFAA